MRERARARARVRERESDTYMYIHICIHRCLIILANARLDELEYSSEEQMM